MVPDVEDSWRRITGWLRDNAPVSSACLGPPATEEDLDLVAALAGVPLPADLLAWWRRSCGATGFVNGRLVPPSFAPYSVDEAVDRREMMLEVAEGDFGDTAGTPSTCWLRPWVPIAHDGGGDLLFVDLRAGDRSGCVMVWTKCEAAVAEPVWPSTAAMLAEIADALTEGTTVDECTADVDDGTLDWG